VAYEYHKREQAEKKAHSLNQKRPTLHAEVFAPRGNRAPYFVALGGRLTLAQAEQLKREARALGLPRDTFVRNFSN
jgi:eukaryotic-like serine/threonine-protein kinase